MDNTKMKTEDIIKTLRVCSGIGCVACMFDPGTNCIDYIMALAADRLEEMDSQHIKIQDNSKEVYPPEPFCEPAQNGVEVN